MVQKFSLILLLGASIGAYLLLTRAPSESDTTYAGADSTWYFEAARRIDSLRKGWITIEVLRQTETATERHQNNSPDAAACLLFWLGGQRPIAYWHRQYFRTVS